MPRDSEASRQDKEPTQGNGMIQTDQQKGTERLTEGRQGLYEWFLLPNIEVLELAAKDIDLMCGGSGDGEEWANRRLTEG